MSHKKQNKPDTPQAQTGSEPTRSAARARIERARRDKDPEKRASISNLAKVFQLSQGTASKLKHVSFALEHKGYKSSATFYRAMCDMSQLKGMKAPQLRDYAQSHDRETVKVMAKNEEAMSHLLDNVPLVADKMTPGEVQILESQLDAILKFLKVLPNPPR